MTKNSNNFILKQEVCFMIINAPSNWQKIEEDNYNKYAVMNNEFMHCLGAYLRTSNGENKVITFYDYGRAERNAIDQIRENLLINEEENRVVDGSPEDKDFEDTSLTSLVWYEKFIFRNNDAFIHISKVLADNGTYLNMVQIYFWDNENLCSCQCKLGNAEIESIETHVLEDDVIAEIIDSIK